MTGTSRGLQALAAAIALTFLVTGCTDDPKPTSPPAVSGIGGAQSAAEDRLDDCGTQANLVADVQFDRATKRWPAEVEARLDRFDFAPDQPYPTTSALLVKVANGRVSWAAAPKATVCFAAYAFPVKGNSQEYHNVEGVTQNTGSFALPAGATMVTVQGWLPTESAGNGTNGFGPIPSDFNAKQLKNCREHGNVVGTVRRDPKTGAWQAPTIRTIVKGQKSQTAKSLVILMGRNNYAKYQVRPDVVACDSEVSYQGHKPFTTDINHRRAIYSPPNSMKITLTGYSVLLYDSSVDTDGEGSLKLHNRR